MPCCCRSKKVRDNDDYDADEFDGPVKNRGCTDVIFLLLFIGLIGSVGYLAYYGIQHNGDPFRIIFGMDSWGNTCNKKNVEIPTVSDSGRDMTGLMNLYNYDDSMGIIDNTKPKLCVKQCPGENITTGADLKLFAEETGSKLCFYDIAINDYPSEFSGSSCPGPEVTATVSVLHRCVSKLAIEKIQTVTSSLAGTLDAIAPNFIDKFVSDIERSWQKILYLCAIAVGVGLFLCIFMRFFAGVIIWTVYIGCILGTLAATGFCWYQWYDVKSIGDAEKEKRWLIISACVSGASIIVLLILIVMRKRIKLVVQLFKEAGKAIGKMPLLLIQPLWTVILLAIFLGGLGYIFMYILSAGAFEVDSNTGFVSIKGDKILFYLKWYYLFIFLWVLNFVIACHQMTVAGAIADWYFTRNKSNLGCCSPILQSIRRLICFHLGSIAFGSLLIAIVQFVRCVLSYVQKRIAGKTGKLFAFILKCLQCCLWCFERFLKFINRNAYIEIAIYGYNFCTAAKRAFTVILQNVLRVAAINSVGDFVLLLGKLGTVGIIVAIGIQLFKDDNQINFIWVPLAIAGIVAFLIAHCFFSVYEMAIDTIFLCFCEDCQYNDGETKPFYMSASLMQFVTKS